MQRHSKGMIIGGVVMVSLTPVALLVSGVAALGKGICNAGEFNDCDGYNPTIYGSLLTGAVLLGVGLPLIIVGAQKEPVDSNAPTATISPWATANAAGLGVRVDL